MSVCTTTLADPLPTKDQNPFLASLDLPLPLDARTPERTWTFDATLNWGSSALLQTSGTHSLLVDAETRELRIGFTRQLAERWAVSIDLPYRELTGGSLDGFIDNWHDFFGLAEGVRPQLPRDQLAIEYRRGNTQPFAATASARGLGDITLRLAHQLIATPETAVRTALSVKLPTGENHWYLSSDGTDVSALLIAEQRLHERWSIRGQAGLTWLGDNALPALPQEDFIWSAHGAASWRALPRLELTAQIDAHRGVYRRTPLGFFDDTLVLSLGGAIHLRSGWTIQLALSEDIAVERSPDVVFVMGLKSPTRQQ